MKKKSLQYWYLAASALIVIAIGVLTVLYPESFFHLEESMRHAAASLLENFQGE